MRAFSPVAVARLGQATRPGEALKHKGRWRRVEIKWCFSLPFPLLTKEGGVRAEDGCLMTTVGEDGGTSRFVEWGWLGLDHSFLSG